MLGPALFDQENFNHFIFKNCVLKDDKSSVSA